MNGVDGPVAFDAVAELEWQARSVLDAVSWQYLSDLAEDGAAAARQQEALRAVQIEPRIFVDTSSVKTEARVLGATLGTPIFAAPLSLQGLMHPEGEVAIAQGCRDAHSVAVVSSGASKTLEDIAASACQWWFQIYPLKDRALTRDIIQKACDLGASAVVLTADVPVLGRRPALRGPLPHHPAVLAGLTRPGENMSEVYERLESRPLIWEDLRRLREHVPVPLVVKGVINADDAARCVAEGVDAVVVSTHGGRQLDCAPAPIEVLPSVSEAVAGEAVVLADGGVRRGSDVLKMLVRGAAAVLVGRPISWGLSCGGASGVRAVIDHLTEELASTMALTGMTAVPATSPPGLAAQR
jgi:4-hydroxymandelate oxidase